MEGTEPGRSVGRGTATAAAVLAVLTLVVLAVAGWLWFQGWRHRRPGLARPAPAPPTAARPVPRRERRPARAKAAIPAAPAAPAAEAAPGDVFRGQPVAWSVGQNQAILCQERPEGLAPTYLIVMSQDYEVLGTLYLSKGDPVLPSRFLIKDASWGEGKHFGGQDVLLGLVACPPGTQDGRALRDAVGREAWWRGKALQAFQMDF